MNEIIISFYARRYRNAHFLERSKSRSYFDRKRAERLIYKLFINKMGLPLESLSITRAHKDRTQNPRSQMRFERVQSRAMNHVHAIMFLCVTFDCVARRSDRSFSFFLQSDGINLYSPCVAWNNPNLPVRRRATG